MNEIKDNSKRCYSNSTKIETTKIDVRLIAGYIDGEVDERLCEIIYSPEQAKLTMLMLEKAIEEFEKNHRKIDLGTNTSKTEGK